jgi:hypothetical protein
MSFMLSVTNKPFMLCVIMLGVVKLSVIVLNVITLNVVAPFHTYPIMHILFS